MDVSASLSGPEGLVRADPAPPSTLVIFGAAGDLTKRLLMPSLYNLQQAGLLQEGFQVIGVDRVDLDNDAYRNSQTATMRSFVSEKGGEFASDELNNDAWGWVHDRLFYQIGDFEDPAAFAALKDRISGNCIFYLAIAARFFGPVLSHLADSGLMQEGDNAFRRVVIEKPFGHDLASAKALNRLILNRMDESQVFRIDHFLGKETVQNIMALRFSNGIFEPLWNRNYIDHVQITAAETVGVETRGHFYEPTGALRDMVPNHMFQLLAMTAMEPPNSFDADAVRAEKAWCAASMAQDGWAARRHQATAKSATWRRTARPRPSSPCGSKSTTSAGPGCRSMSGPASGWHRGGPRSWCISSRRPMRCSAAPRSTN